MNFTKAKEYMENGGRVTHPSWNSEDFLRMKDHKILDDGGNDYGKKLTPEELDSNHWRKHADDADCAECQMPFDKKSLHGARFEKERKICESCKEVNDKENEEESGY